MRRARYQFGSLELLRGAKQDVWTFRFYQPGADGERQYRRIRVGTTEQYPTETTALKALEGLRLSVNSGKLQAANHTFGGVIERYQREELPERFSTRVSYKSLLKRWIQPKWGDVPLNEIRTLEVEHWLKSMTLAPKPKSGKPRLQPGSKGIPPFPRIPAIPPLFHSVRNGFPLCSSTLQFQSCPSEACPTEGGANYAQSRRAVFHSGHQ